ncbi:MAG: membrane protease subunit [Bacteroidetes bacterium]|nr:membrane protease subunit [Bacteroidota bacterium]
MAKFESTNNLTFGIFIKGFLLILAVIIFWMFAYPRYRVWQQGLEGEAELKRAEQNRKIAVQEAEAKKEAAKSLADAEVIRAEGVAKANAIIGNSLKGNEDYLRYLWIDNLEKNQNSVIYVPTEAGLPILESGRLKELRKAPSQADNK